MLCDVGHLLGWEVPEDSKPIGIRECKGNTGPKECMPEPASDIFGLLLLRDGYELHWRD